MGHTVRRSSLLDIDRLIPLFDAYRQFYGQQSDLNIARRFLNERLSRHESVVLIAEDPNGVVIGFAQVFPAFSSILAAPISIFHDLYVVPAARRCGVGTMLLKAVAETARATGAVRLELATAITNTTAQRLYEALGWKRDEEFYMYSLSL
ncbi:MAG: GNAT family N-acetyltransferase [Nitrospira sp.]|nr:GNAT family N-acetyltransferase [Nitrospira sp.]